MKSDRRPHVPYDNKVSPARVRHGDYRPATIGRLIQRTQNAWLTVDYRLRALVDWMLLALFVVVVVAALAYAGKVLVPFVRINF